MWLNKWRVWLNGLETAFEEMGSVLEGMAMVKEMENRSNGAVKFMRKDLRGLL